MGVCRAPLRNALHRVFGLVLVSRFALLLFAAFGGGRAVLAPTLGIGLAIASQAAAAKIIKTAKIIKGTKQINGMRKGTDAHHTPLRDVRHGGRRRGERVAGARGSAWACGARESQYGGVFVRAFSLRLTVFRFHLYRVVI